VKHILLNNIEHKDLRISTKQSAAFGDNVHYGLIVPSELKAAKNVYPIFIQKDSNTGKFFLSVLLGFQEGENLFLDDAGWNAAYIPLSFLRQPFVIGQQAQIENGEKVVKRVINLDIDSPKINAQDGERLFTEDGKSTPYLNSVADILESLHMGLTEADQFIDQLLAYNLLERFTLKVTFNEHKAYELTNFYTINEDGLKSLADESVISLYRNGNLEKIYSILHSHARVSSLIELKTKQDLM